MIVTPVSMPTNTSRWVGSLPSAAGVMRCLDNDPASPNTNTIGRNRPSNMVIPKAALYQVVLTDMPANALPLLFAADVNAYRTSENPCGPVFSMPAR